MTMKVISVNIAKKTIFIVDGKEEESGIKKKPVLGSIYLDKETARGDVVSDRGYHGGNDKTVYGYSHQHYHYWKTKYDLNLYEHWKFGGNITFDELDEKQVKVGNKYSCGDVVIQATEPRYPCFKLGLVFDSNTIVKEFRKSHRCGVYFRVLKCGDIVAGDEFVLMEEAQDNPSIAEIFGGK
jgi:MOSC domain-containing protein YiiM